MKSIALFGCGHLVVTGDQGGFDDRSWIKSQCWPCQNGFQRLPWTEPQYSPEFVLASQWHVQKEEE